MDDSEVSIGEPSRHSNYWIKTFGASLSDYTFSRLPTVILRARQAIPDVDIVGFLACAIEKPPILTGLMFCDRRKHYPQGLPARTPPVTSRLIRNGYDVYATENGGVFVVAHWYYSNGAVGPFQRVH